MWERGELKERGLAAFKANYWKCVLVALILTIIAGGCSNSGRKMGNGSFGNGFREGFEQGFNEANGNSADAEEIAENIINGNAFDEFMDDLKNGFNNGSGTSSDAAFAILLVIGVVLVAVVIAIIIGFTINALLLNPIKLGCTNFFLKNLDEPAGLNSLSAGFEGNYKNVVKVLFFRDLYLFLWCLIPIAGPIISIVKKYEYMMIPYLLAEDPNMDRDEAFAESRSMMDGQKWNAFVLKLSFIGWILLSVITLGILSVMYVTPYMESTIAALYDTLRYGYNKTGQDYIEGSYTDVNAAV
ncbi:MAG: DUF975 family protein [Lachnospiraceae bacterium]|nr:DUF975 family protein [Lachnospiraceae bacterium]MBR6485919.1 DUF975 family protein [Lachnospiraceae bacterium]